MICFMAHVRAVGIQFRWDREERHKSDLDVAERDIHTSFGAVSVSDAGRCICAILDALTTHLSASLQHYRQAHCDPGPARTSTSVNRNSLPLTSEYRCHRIS